MSLLLELEVLQNATAQQYPESVEPVPYDAMVVLGHGNIADGNLSTEGPSRGTIENAYAAATYIRDGRLREDGIVVASGGRPEGCDGDFSISEAGGITEVITTITGAPVVRDDTSGTTFANIRNIRNTLSRGSTQKGDFTAEPLRVAVVSSKGHAKRGALLVKKSLGERVVVDVLPADAIELTGKPAHESLITRAKESVLTAMTRVAFLGLDGTTPEGFDTAEQRYNRALRGSKRVIARKLDKVTGSNYGS